MVYWKTQIWKLITIIKYVFKSHYIGISHLEYFKQCRGLKMNNSRYKRKTLLLYRFLLFSCEASQGVPWPRSRQN